MAELTDDQIWERLQQRLPSHDCGQQFQAGGAPGVGPVLVCTQCSFVTGVSQGWIDAIIDQILAEHRIREAVWEAYDQGFDGPNPAYSQGE